MNETQRYRNYYPYSYYFIYNVMNDYTNAK